MVIHAYNELVDALELEDGERAKSIIDGLYRTLAFDSMPGLAAGLASLYAGFYERLQTADGLPEVLRAVRHLREIWIHAEEVSKNPMIKAKEVR